MPDFDDGPDFDDAAMFGDVDENDPRSVARWARRMGEQMGEDLPPGFEEQIARMEAGEMPDDDEFGDGGFGDDSFSGFDDED